MENKFFSYEKGWREAREFLFENEKEELLLVSFIPNFERSLCSHEQLGVFGNESRNLKFLYTGLLVRPFKRGTFENPQSLLTGGPRKVRTKDLKIVFEKIFQRAQEDPGEILSHKNASSCIELYGLIWDAL